MAASESTAALSARAIVWDDAGARALPEAYREAAWRTWIGRAGGELHTAGTFTFLCVALARVRAPAALVEMARAAVEDEQRHAELCRRMASVYAGRDVPMPPLRAVPVPAFRRASKHLQPTLHVIGQCCINETTAGAFLQRCLDGTTEPLARAVLLELLGDEIQHARLGWAHLTNVCGSAQGRDEIAAWLEPMLALNLRRWRADYVRLPGDALWPHGCPPAHEIDAAALDAIRSLILPGFERAGVDVTAARAWCDSLVQREPTDA